MSMKSLNSILARGEGFTIEFKRSGTTHIGHEICAFANAAGGTIFIGVTDDGEICGVGNHNRLKSRVQNIASSADPRIAVEMETVGSVLAVRIPEQGNKPYSFGGKFYTREGANSRTMSRSEIGGQFFIEGLLHFDEMICNGFTLDNDLDRENWSLFQQRARIPKSMDAETALKNLKLLLEDGRMTYAGAFLLAHDVRKFLLNANVKCVLFAGNEKGLIIDRQEFHGDIYSMIDAVCKWVYSKLNLNLIVEGLTREERLELPRSAIREAVVNALVHRDYRTTANTQIYLFSNRLEIVSPGGLPAGMSEPDLGNKSVPRNRLLFAILDRMNVIEGIGSSGIRRIRELCKDSGVADPVFEVSESWVTVAFPRNSWHDYDATGQKVKRSTTMVEDEPLFQFSMNDLNWFSHYLQDLTDQVTDQVRVNILLRCENPQSLQALMDWMGVKHRSHFRTRQIKPLLDMRLLEMTHPDKPSSSKQRYRLSEKGRQLLGAFKRRIQH